MIPLLTLTILLLQKQNELTPEGYAAHLQHNSAPQPLSVREAELASIRAAEKAAGLDAYKGASERKSHVGAVGLTWTDEVEAALKELAEESSQNTLVLLVRPIYFVIRLFIDCLAVDRPRERNPRAERRLPPHSQRGWSQLSYLRTWCVPTCLSRLGLQH